MANVIKIKRGSGTPSTSNTEAYELAYDYTADILYIHDGASNTMVPVGTGTVDTSGTPIASEYARFTDANTIQGISAAGVRTDLGLVVGTNVQAQNDYLQDIADLSTNNPTQNGYVLAYNDNEPGFELVEQSGGISFNGSTTNGLLTYGNSTTADVEPELTYNGAGQLQINRSGSNAILQLRSDTNNTRIHFKENTDVAWNIGYDATNNWFSFYDASVPATPVKIKDGAGSDTLVVDSTSRVGIGTASPSGKLGVQSATGEIGFNAGTSSSPERGNLYFTTDGSGWKFNIGKYQSSSFSSLMTFQDNGNVGIGVTSPSFSYGSLGLEIQSTGDTSLRLERDGSTAFEISARSSDVLIYNPGTARNFRFGLGGTEEFRMDTSGNFHADADVIAFSTTTASDIKFKENVKSIPYGLKEVLQMNPVEFDWIEKRNGIHDIGFIAQEMEKIVPEVIKETETLEVGGTHKTMDYAKLTSILVQAIQEQQEQINELKEKLNG